MSQRFPAVTGTQVLRAIRKSGWYVDYIDGSHHQLVNVTSGKRVSVPVHAGKVLKRKTLKKILELTNVSLEEFRKLL